MTTSVYRLFTARLIAPWALQGTRPHGDVLEIGGGVGAMAQRLLRTSPDLRIVETDFDPEMCSIASRNWVIPLGSRSNRPMNRVLLTDLWAILLATV